MITLLLCLLLTDRIPVYTISKVHKELEGYGERLLDRPLAMESHGGDLFLFDDSYQLWALDDQGSVLHTFGTKADLKTAYTKGPGPGEFAQGFMNMYFVGDELKIFHRSGFREETFALDGSLKSSKRYRSGWLYNHDGVKVLAKATPLDGNNDQPLPLKLVFLIADASGRHEINLMDPKFKDIGFRSSAFVKRWGDFLFISTANGIRKNIYYILYDLNRQKIIEHAHTPLKDLRISMAQERVVSESNPGNTTVPIMMGCTTSDSLGYVITEHTFSEKYRIIRTFDPKTPKWDAMRIEFGDHFDNLFFFQHLGGRNWAAYAGEGLAFFEIAPDNG